MRQQFASWLTADDNPYFARNFANRVWAVYFGAGIVDPVDDFSVRNPASHPQLLDGLARSFADSGFDIRALEKQILMSAAYQRSATPNETNLTGHQHFARQRLRPLLAEVALDTIDRALGTRTRFGSNGPDGCWAIEIGTNRVMGPAGGALSQLGRGERDSLCDCDRQTELDLRQNRFLLNSRMIHRKIEQAPIRELLGQENPQLVDHLYLRFYSRYPTISERAGVLEYLRSGERESAFDDLLWAFINSREFLSNH